MSAHTLGDEAVPLITEEKPTREPQERRLGSLGIAVGVLAVIGVAAFAGHRSNGTTATTLTDSPDNTATTNGKIYLYKRTTPSVEPEEDCMVSMFFLFKYN
jgi:hypothetical protein